MSCRKNTILVLWSSGDQLRHRRRSFTIRRNTTEKMNNNLLSLIESGVTGLTLTLTLEDLKIFATDIVEQAKAKLLPVMVSASHEALLSKKEVMEKFSVCPGTLWNWERNGYLIPVKMNRKIYYRQADVDRVIIERGKR